MIFDIDESNCEYDADKSDETTETEETNENNKAEESNETKTETEETTENKIKDCKNDCCPSCYRPKPKPRKPRTGDKPRAYVPRPSMRKINPEFKICFQCGESKNFKDEFYKTHNKRCRKCHNAYQTGLKNKRYEADPSKKPKPNHKPYIRVAVKAKSGRKVGTKLDTNIFSSYPEELQKLILDDVKNGVSIPDIARKYKTSYPFISYTSMYYLRKKGFI
jgi:hypothetical protein